MRLTDYKALTFDCYGTLIDWEAGLGAVLVPWAREQGLDLADEELLLAYADHEAAVEQETPAALYPDVLAAAFRRTGDGLGCPVSDEWAERLGGSVPDWPAYPDSADALARLAKHYQLIILSNVHRDGFAGSNQHLQGDFAAVITAEDVGAYKPAENHFRALDATLPGLGVITNCDDDLFAASNRKLGVAFDWVVTAQQVGAYKPDERPFHAAFERVGLPRERILHVAQSLFHDHVTAKRLGLSTVWIDRRGHREGSGATPVAAASPDATFPELASFADAAL